MDLSAPRLAARRSLARAARRAVYGVKTHVANHPALALPLARRLGIGIPLGSHTDIVIEGYPRSANSFAVAAFRLAQRDAVEVAHHVHAPAQVIAAVRRAIPALVLVRDPEDSVLEFLLVRPFLTPRDALRGWIRFYSALLPHRRGFVVGPFPEVITDLGRVIRRVNDRFGTSFAEFEHTEENVRACFEAMDWYWQTRVGEGPELERLVGRPSELRERLKDELRDEFRSPALGEARARACALYRRLAGVDPPERQR